LTPDGRFVALSSLASNLTADEAGPPDRWNVYVHARVTKTTERGTDAQAGLSQKDEKRDARNHSSLHRA
jgi:hypothetical protein